MDRIGIENAAAFLWQARIRKKRVPELPEQFKPASLSDGYAIQDAMAALAGQSVAGWKIAATSAAGQRHIGVTEPISGRLFSGFVLAENATIDSNPLHMRVVEAEFAFVMRRGLAPRDVEYDRTEVKNAIADLHLAIEIPDARFERFDNIGAAQITADDAFASWFVLGPKVANWESLDLPTQQVCIQKNGALAAEGQGANALGDPLIALTWLANHLNGRRLGLSAGDIITTGTCVTPVAIAPRDAITAQFPGLGSVGVSFT
jgi:2-keto-4-pentenoate hydratase